ncbi:MAG TPA: MlaD family protein [Terriglobia bacterium]|nr:MlaD family protein [Terriglobia bacterium]
MAQRRSLAWTELRVGILVITSFALLALAIFYVSGQSGFFVPKYTVTAYFQNANNLRDGAEVSLEGVTIGNVDKVEIGREPDPNKAVEAKLSLDKKYQNIIRSDSKVTISTIGLLGDSKVDITRGTQAGVVIADNGYIQGTEEGDIRKIVQGTNDFIANLQVLSEDFKRVADRVDQGEGTLGQFLTNTSIFDNTNKVVKEADQLVRDARTGPGTMGRIISDDALYTKMMDVTNHMDEAVQKIQNGNGTVARFINDPGLYTKFDDLTARVQNMADRLDRGEGTLGKLMSRDDALYNDLRSGVTKFNALVDSVQNGQGSAGKFIKDPTLFNSLNETSSEIQKLIYDFRQNPKKFLTINFKLF